MFSKFNIYKTTTIAFIVSAILIPHFFSQAVTKDELQVSIAQHNLEIQKLEKEIAEYESKLNITQQEKKTLANAVAQLDTTRKKLASEISLTQEKITTTEFNIERLEIEIKSTEKTIADKTVDLRDAVLLMQEADQSSLVEVFLSGDTLSDSLNKIDSAERLQVELRKKLNELKDVKANLEQDLYSLDESKRNLDNLESKLVNQKVVADSNRKNKAVLLDKTKNEETAYQNLLDERKKIKEEFEAELLAFESQLQSLDPSQIPGAAPGILAWPTKEVKINQYFGDTSFSRNNPQIYKGRGHRGVDFRAFTGTEILSVGKGIVLGTGNTDLGCPNASWGKWVLIKHPNGLASGYAHLSQIAVSTGQEVNVGDVVGYSGETGNTVGPHLHLSVFASEGVRIGKLIKADGTPSSCTEMPLSPLNGYLNPLAYMPEINPATNKPL